MELVKGEMNPLFENAGENNSVVVPANYVFSKIIESNSEALANKKSESVTDKKLNSFHMDEKGNMVFDYSE
ncbi:hypothetical protein KA005_37960 [bacterium]|nr:hypothetical protein [bacterium]